MRWTAKRKAEVLDAIAATPEASAEIMERHGLSAEELAHWSRARAERGDQGLRVFDRYRRARATPPAEDAA
jgi:hypothetical protein